MIEFKFTPDDKGNPPRKLADAELHFTPSEQDCPTCQGRGELAGPLDTDTCFTCHGKRTILSPFAGLKLIGFSIWERRGGGRNVTFPARQYSVNGERQSFALLRPISDIVSQERLRDLILGHTCDTKRSQWLARRVGCDGKGPGARNSCQAFSAAGGRSLPRGALMRAALYARVSTLDQEPENQLAELRRYAEARRWTASEFVDRGISGAKDRRPALDALLTSVRRRKADVVVCWSLDRLGRSLRHLIALLDEFQAVGVGFISLREGLDCTTPAGRLQWQIIGAISEFERARIAERVRAGLVRARAQGRRLGRPKAVVPTDRLAAVTNLSLTDAAVALGVSRSTVKRWRRGQESPPRGA